MFKVCKEHGRRLIKVPDYWKSHYLGTQWFFFIFSPPHPLQSCCGTRAWAHTSVRSSCCSLPSSDSTARTAQLCGHVWPKMREKYFNRGQALVRHMQGRDILSRRLVCYLSGALNMPDALQANPDSPCPKDLTRYMKIKPAKTTGSPQLGERTRGVQTKLLLLGGETGICA